MASNNSGSSGGDNLSRRWWRQNKDENTTKQNEIGAVPGNIFVKDARVTKWAAKGKKMTGRKGKVGYNTVTMENNRLR